MYDFGKNDRPMTIGERRPEKVESGPGPGHYNEQPVQERPRGGRIDQAPRSPERRPSESDNVAPGSYEPTGIQPFDKNAKGVKIMPKGREMPSPIRDNPGPGTYAGIDPPPQHVSVPDLGRNPGRPDPAHEHMIDP